MDMTSPVRILILIILFLSPFCKSDDQLTEAKPLSYGDTVVSIGGDFALGFFSPTSSKTSLYLGIWYNKIPGRTVVWTANRDSPISSGMLAISNTSDLVLSDSQGRTSWTAKNDAGVPAAAVLLDTGNLVLRSPDGTVAWQSFDHPTDTLLPGVRLLLSYKAQLVGRVVAWKGPDDPSSGDFSLGGDLGSPTIQALVWRGTRLYSRFTMFDAVIVFGGNVSYESFVSSGGGLYYVYTMAAGAPYRRIVLDYTGAIRCLSWDSTSSSWTLIYQRSTGCDLYSSCGPFGFCDLGADGSGRSSCRCLDGFEPDDGGRGCRRKEALECGQESSFVAFVAQNIPDKYLRVSNTSLDQCAAQCNSNCSCTAYAYAALNNADALTDPSRCFHWTGELVDTRKSGTNGVNLYLRLANSSVQKNNNLVKIVTPIMAGVVIFTCIALAWICKRRGKIRMKENQKKLVLGYVGSSNEIGGENAESPFVNFRQITAATNNFSDANLLGRGGFGKVYKGILKNGNEVAVKRLTDGSGQGIMEFRNEVALIAKLQHKNLVRVLGCCIHEEEKLLIYEYLPNKSLDTFLFDATRKSVLDWVTRFKIINGVARGLLYLHQDSRLTIIHRDLKASNILLDAEMNPKISDFGMARIFGGNQQQGNTTRVVGTYGYMSPEYVTEGAFSVKLDAYSFGVLLLEIVSGLKISSQQHIMNFSSLIVYAWKLWNDGKAIDLVDSSIVESCPVHEVLRCIHVGLLCVQDNPHDRPIFSSVILMLENKSALLPAPKQPAYFGASNRETKEIRENMENSVNKMSITTLEAR